METIQTILDDIINQIIHTTKRKRNDSHSTNKKQKTTHPLDGFVPPQDIKHWTSNRNELIGMTTWTKLYEHGADFIIFYDDGTMSMSVHEIKSR